MSNGSLVIRAEKVGADTVLAHIVAMVAAAQRSCAPIQRIADTVAGYFVPAVLALAIAAFAAWAVWGPPPALAYAFIVTRAETALAAALILGAFSNIVDLGGVMLAFVIWSTANGFGGPYKAGSTDIGASIIYVLMFVGLFLSQSGLHLGLDRRLTPIPGRWGWLASGPPGR